MRTLWTTIQCPLVSTKLVWRMFSQPSSSSFTCCSLQWLCSWPTKPFQTSWRSSTIQWCPSHTKRSRSLLHQVSSNTQSFVVSQYLYLQYLSSLVLQSGIALYPGKAQLLSCMHHYHDNIPPLAALDRPEERNCIKEDVIYHGPYSNQTQVCFRSSSNVFWRNGAINNLWRNMSVAEASHSGQRTDWREEPRTSIPPVQPEWNGGGFQRDQLHDFCQI